ncbi:MAG: PD-(D/E)XK nuclease family protein [Trueperaceae bacterium]
MPKNRQSGSGETAGRTVVLAVDDDAVFQAPRAPGAFVVTPNRRAAAAHGVPWVSLELLAEQLLRSTKRQRASGLAQRRAMRYAVARVWRSGGDGDGARDRSARAGDAHAASALDGDGATVDVDGIARAVEGSVREALRAGIDEMEAEPSTPRLRQVVALARAYREVLAASALVDPAEVSWAVARAVRSGADVERRQVHVVGYTRLDRDVVAFLDAVAAAGSVVIVPAGPDAPYAPSRQAAERLSALGWRLERSNDDALSTAPVWFAAKAAALPGGANGYHFPSQDAEVRFVLTEVKRLLLAGEAAGDIAVVVRDAQAYGPHLEAVAWEYGVPLHVSIGTPLARTQAGAWTLALLQAVGFGLPFEETSRVLAHPLTGGFAPQAWVEARAKHPRGLAAWRAVDARADHLDWPRSATRAAHAERLFATWEAFGVVERASALAEQAALLRMRIVVGTLTAPGGGTDEGPVPLATFIDEAGDVLRLEHVQRRARATGHGDAVAVHTPLALLGGRYRHVYVLGAAEGVFPARVSEDAVLDFHERAAAAAIGLPLESAVEAAQREAAAFEAVVRATRERLTLTYPEALQRASLIPSPYFAALGIRPQDAPRKAPASLEEVRRARLLSGTRDGSDPAIAAAVHAREVEARRESAQPPDEYDGVVGEPFDTNAFRFSATQLVSLGQCGFRWLGSVPWKLQEPEEAEDELTPLLRGSLYHVALEYALQAARAEVRRTVAPDGVVAPDDAGAPYGARAAFRDAALAALEGAFGRAETEVGATYTPNWEARREEHVRQLRRVIRAESFLPEGAEVFALESLFGRRGGPQVTWKGFEVTGRIDRIDRRPDGIVLIDYKTSGSKPKGAQDDAGKATLDVQLPLYQQAAAPALFRDETVAAAQYYSLTKAAVIDEVSVDDELDAALERFAARMWLMLRSGTYPVLPDVDRAACGYCQLDLVCRTGPRTERMRAQEEDRAWAREHPSGSGVEPGASNGAGARASDPSDANDEASR